MLSIKQILTGSVILSIFILPSCIDDSLDNQCPTDEVVDVRMTITLPEPIVKSISTKAYSTRTDYNTVNDINVLVFNTTGTVILGSYYFDANYAGTAPLPTVTPGLPLNSSTLSTILTFNGVEANSKFYLVANYGSKITSTATINSLNDLKNLNQIATNGIPNKCMMYAEATPVTLGSVTNMDAKLVRTLAMVTVKIDGTNLSVGTGKEIRIIPKTIKLRNVPTSCVLGNDINNASGTNTTNVLAGDEAIVTSWGTLTSATGTKIAGGHEGTAIPLFQFENKQGEKSPNPDQTAKKVGDKPNSSYLEIEAFYQYYESSAIKMSGTIIYRFSLGSNITTNFDVERNTQYAVTLDLSGWGGALEDGHINGSADLVVEGDAPGVSWRVDLALRDWGFLQDEFNFDAHASSGYIQVLKGGYKVDFVAGYESTNWLKFLKSNGSSWIFPSGSADFKEIGTVPNMYYVYYILPWQYSGDPNDPNVLPYRETKIKTWHDGGDIPQVVTIRQWAPILLENGLYMERFEEDGNSLAWGNDNITLPNTQSGYTFTFDGVEVNGWINTLYLYNKAGTPKSPSAQLCMQKAGYDLTGIPGGAPLTASQRAAYYMPSVSELGKVIGYVGDPTDPYQYHNPIKTTLDYWSSSAPSDNLKKYTYYWDHVTTPQVSPVTTITTTTNTRNTARQVRCVYRYSLNSNAASLP
nr:fimbrial protein [uncultured Macellibacteroides sp.]